MKKAFLLTIKGRVQGVGYRWFTRQCANELSVNGYVKNLYNGDVEVFVEGETTALERFMLDLKQGPSFSRVDQIVIKEFPYEAKYTDFQVTF